MSRSEVTKSANRKRKQQSEEPQEFMVEKVIRKRYTKEGGIEYFLKWQGFPMEECTWEPEANISCHELIADYERRIARKKEKGEPEIPTEKEPHEIIGGRRAGEEIFFLVKYKDGSAELVPSKKANVEFTNLVIQFYERHVTFS